MGNTWGSKSEIEKAMPDCDDDEKAGWAVSFAEDSVASSSSSSSSSSKRARPSEAELDEAFGPEGGGGGGGGGGGSGGGRSAAGGRGVAGGLDSGGGSARSFLCFGEGDVTPPVLARRYQVQKLLGRGSYAVVAEALDTVTGDTVAIKAVDKAQSLDKQLRLEVDALRLASDHPNVTRLLEVVDAEDSKHLYLVQECCFGGELFDRLVDKGTYSEKDASAAFKQLLGALEHLHARGVVHRDLKPENILLQSKDSDVDIKLSDFGVATILQRVKGRRRQVAKTFIGSLLYLAPEIALGAPYTERVDMWSAGIILYCLLAAEPPLNVGTIEEYIQVVGVSGKVADTIGRNSASATVPGGGGGGGGRGGPGGGSLFGGVGEEDSFDGGGGGGGGRSMSRSQEEIVRSEASWPSFDSEAWADVSPIAKDLVLALLKRDPSQRLTASEALRHPWIAGGASNRSRPLSQSYATNLRSNLHAIRKRRKR
eukprot:g4925.t1